MAQKRKISRPRTSSQQYAALVEALREEFKVLAEAQHAMKDDMNRQFHSLRSELVDRISILEAALRQNTDAIRKNSEDIRKNSEDLARIEAEVRRLDRTLQGKIDQAALDALEKRVAALEARVGIGPRS